MKSKDLSKEKTFKPFKIEIEIETEEEAGLLLLVMNESDLRKKLITGNNSIETDYPRISRISSNFDYKDRNKIFQIILNHIEDPLIKN